jgi:hypothetical protein
MDVKPYGVKSIYLERGTADSTGDWLAVIAMAEVENSRLYP